MVLYDRGLPVFAKVFLRLSIIRSSLLTQKRPSMINWMSILGDEGEVNFVCKNDNISSCVAYGAL